jgi:hypothetical protein
VRSPSLDIQSNPGRSESLAPASLHIGWTLDELNTLDSYMKTKSDVRFVDVPTPLPCLHISSIRSDHGGDY